MRPKHPKSFRLSREATRLLARLADKLQIAQTAILELAIRQMATKEGITEKEPPH